jgi:hypothetical protein
LKFGPSTKHNVQVFVDTYMTTDEARDLVIEGINYAAYRETDSSLHDTDKNRLYGSAHYDL